MASLGRAYLGLLRDYTLPTQMVTAGTLFSVGDVISQHAVEGTTWRDHDNARTLRAGVYGFFLWSPILNRWHAMLNRITFRSRPVEIVARVAVDQVCLAPFGAVCYFTAMGLLESRSLDDIRSRIAANFTRTVKTAVCIFAPAQTISQAVLPLHARPPFMNFASLAFGVYIAGVNSGKQQRPEPLAASADPTPRR